MSIPLTKLPLWLWLGLAPLSALAQTPTPGATPRPFPFATPRPLLPTATTTQPGGARGPATAPANPPPRDVPLVEKKFEQLSDQKISPDGKVALLINPQKWHHAETDNFTVHYRRVTEAQKVVREVEYDLWYVATTLGAGKDRYSRKSHVYVFEDTDEWKAFLEKSSTPMKWAASYAYGDELFLNVRGGGNSGPGTSFDSHTLAHETTHAVIARLYRGDNWPLWLNEGFAEYMAGASIAARKGITARHFERNLQHAELPVEKLFAVTAYPTSDAEIYQLYNSSEKFVRFVMTELPKDRGVKYIEALAHGNDPKSTLMDMFGDKFKDWGDFLKKYERFSK